MVMLLLGYHTVRYCAYFPTLFIFQLLSKGKVEKSPVSPPFPRTGRYLLRCTRQTRQVELRKYHKRIFVWTFIVVIFFVRSTVPLFTVASLAIPFFTFLYTCLKNTYVPNPASGRTLMYPDWRHHCQMVHQRMQLGGMMASKRNVVE